MKPKIIYHIWKYVEYKNLLLIVLGLSTEDLAQLNMIINS